MSKDYFNGLSVNDKARYVRKFQCLHGTVGETFETMDPYCFSDRHWIDDVRQWPAVDFPAIYTYLIDTPGVYTREKLNAFKSLEAHNYYTRYHFMYIFLAIIYILVIHSGWVQTVYYHDLVYGNKNCVLKALVNPSQRLSEKPHEPWIAVDKLSGTVVTAHCTCMAGYVIGLHDI